MLNFCSYMGRLTAAPEVRYTNDSIPVATFTVAVDRDMKTKSGEKLTDFFPCTAWRQTAEYIGKYFNKGDLVTVSGRNQTRSWTDKEGNKRKEIELVVDNIYCARKAGNAEQSAAPAQTASIANQNIQEGMFTEIPDDGDLPF